MICSQDIGTGGVAVCSGLLSIDSVLSSVHKWFFDYCGVLGNSVSMEATHILFQGRSLGIHPVLKDSMCVAPGY